MMKSDYLRADDIADRLADQLEGLLADLLPQGRKDGVEWRVGSVAGEPGNSLGVHLRGEKRGVWADFAAGIGGDALDLVAAVKDLSLPEAMRWAVNWLGIDDRPNVLPKGVAGVSRSAPCKPPKDKLIRIQKRIAESVSIWSTPAETYLWTRGINLREIKGLFDPRSLRFLPDAWHWPTETRRPCMLGVIRNLESRAVQGLHLTFLRPDGTGKAEVEKPRLYCGPKAGGAVWLTPDEEITNGLCVGEGIETTLSGLVAGYPAIALLDAGNLGNFAPLLGFEALTVLVDHDPAGRAAAEKLRGRWLAAGREVRLCLPQAEGRDWNDELQEVANG